MTFNRALWRGIKGDEPYPAKTTGADLRKKRKQLLANTQLAGGSQKRLTEVKSRCPFSLPRSFTHCLR
jgi:hypothetical protein